MFRKVLSHSRFHGLDLPAGFLCGWAMGLAMELVYLNSVDIHLLLLVGGALLLVCVGLSGYSKALIKLYNNVDSTYLLISIRRNKSE